MKDIQTNTNPQLPKEDFYKELAEQIQVITEDQSFWVTNLSNASSVIFHELNSLAYFQEKPINWAGFYITNPKNDQQLILGPFQGKVACTEIQFGKGVCGTAASTMQTQVIRDVHQFPGHIACDSASNSEIVVPLVVDGRLVGVLDIDCQEKEGFDDTDRIGLEAIAKIIVDNCTW
ncbi:GAF domain-like protein [Halteromyces radiatus]|uniref:GAF domain-like protein n=1 Tax=Halteromyces radiatus TaxID=101107 RepID=UPI00221F29C1|nr:GAF domain-like protein [Halteromyces radiatus]KAI8089428.1 GAF domain-like protein [Halteromyces radiatus]